MRSSCRTFAAVDVVTTRSVLIYVGDKDDAFAEFARRHGDFALVGVAAVVEQDQARRCSDVRLVFTGVGPVPLLFIDEKGQLRGELLTPQAMNAFAEHVTAGLKPESDLHASAEYRRELAAVLAERALGVAAARAREGH